jgi:hypothetical protein
LGVNLVSNFRFLTINGKIGKRGDLVRILDNPGVSDFYFEGTKLFLRRENGC